MELSNGPRTDWRYTLQLVSARELFQLCDTVVEVLRQEDSLVQVPLPCRVYGDIHGQLLDLLEFFNAFSWPDKRRGDIFSMNYIFLGDFVDRGAYSCDVITLLFSLKILYPTRIFLVRGNHEDRLMNVNYGFQADCIRKFGHDGEDIWERTNDVFEFLPIAALVEEVIFCIHGGIGDSISSLNELRGIQKPIQVVGEINASTTRQDRMILDALWSDPTDNDNVLGVQSSPRGKNTCRFGPDRVQDFNQRNGLKLIIRAHECVQHGYEYFAAGQLLTVFSATNYCNQYNNDGAMVVLVKDDRTGEVVEHAQVIKSGTVDTSHGWNEQQFRAPSPMRRTDRPDQAEKDEFAMHGGSLPRMPI
jgi:diadenosine tetraphosphatase ApaH/serine/threonine PP2A family protein phosphatase